MRMVVALIQPTKLQAVRDALAKIGVDRLSVCDGAGYGRQRGQKQPGMSTDVRPSLLRKVALEIAVNDDFLEKTIDTITHAARSGADGTIGDGKIFVLPLEEVIRLSDTVRGPEGVS